MTSGSFPLTLRVAGRKVVVVGGGHVATRRTLSLLDAGARVVVIAPVVSDSLASSIDRGEVEWIQSAVRDRRPRRCLARADRDR